MGDQDEAERRDNRNGRIAQPLPSFKDLVSFDKGNVDTRPAALTPSAARSNDTLDMTSRQYSDRYSEQANVGRVSDVEPVLMESRMDRRLETVTYAKDQSHHRHSHSGYGHSCDQNRAISGDYSPQRVDSEHFRTSTSSNKRAHEAIEHEAFSYVNPHRLDRGSQRGGQGPINRPTSHPMTRSANEPRQLPRNPSSGLSIRSEAVIQSRDSVHPMERDAHPLSTQTIPSQDSRVTSHLPQKYQVEVQHGSQNGSHFIEARQAAPTSNGVPRSEDLRARQRSSHQGQMLSSHRQPSASPRLSSQTYPGSREAARLSAHSEHDSPRLPMPSKQTRMFDYSGAMLSLESHFWLSSKSFCPQQLCIQDRSGRGRMSEDEVSFLGQRKRMPTTHQAELVDSARYVSLPDGNEGALERLNYYHSRDQQLPTPPSSHRYVPVPGGQTQQQHLPIYDQDRTSVSRARCRTHHPDTLHCHVRAMLVVHIMTFIQDRCRFRPGKGRLRETLRSLDDLLSMSKPVT